MSRRNAIILSLGAALLFAGCAARQVGVLTEYRGRYSYGFEESTFRPCGVPGSDGPWWVIPSDDAQRQRDILVASLPATSRREYFVRWRGTITAQGPAGHLGHSTRYIQVSEILELKPASPADCLK